MFLEIAGTLIKLSNESESKLNFLEWAWSIQKRYESFKYAKNKIEASRLSLKPLQKIWRKCLVFLKITGTLRGLG